MDLFSISNLNAFDDKILPYIYYEHLLAAYLGSYPENRNDFVLNPIQIDFQALKGRFPENITLLFGSADPMRDDMMRLGEKITRAGDYNIKVYEIKYMPHGFLNMDNDHMFPEVGKVNELISKEIIDTVL